MRTYRQQLPALQELLRTKVSKPTLVTMVGDASFKQQWEKRRQFRVELHEQLAALEGAADAVRPVLPEDEERLVPSRRRRCGAFSLLHFFLFCVGRGGALGALRRLLDSESRPARRNFVEI